MNSLDAAYVEEQSKLADNGAWIWLLEIDTEGLVLRYTNNNALGAPNQYYTTWNGKQYFTLPFSVDDINFSTSGAFPEYKLNITDVELDSALRTRIRAQAGLVGRTIRFMIVHSAHLDLTTPAIDELAEILNCEITAEAVVFTMCIPSLLSRRFPRDRYVPGFCRHKFAGALCQYVQPEQSLTSAQISFIPGVAGDAGVRYDTIWVNDADVFTQGFISDVFRTVGIWNRGTGLLTLNADTGFTVSGSLYNDGFFLANSHHHVRQKSVRVFVEADGGKPFIEEAAGESITVQLGYDLCDHTLEACKLRNNTQNFGGSPGIVGGMYG